MKQLKDNPKQYLKCAPHQILRFILESERLGHGPALGEHTNLQLLDFRNEACFMIVMDGREVGFVTMRFGTVNDNRILSKIFVLPPYRKHGCATYVLKGLKPTHIDIPVPFIRFISLCRTLGFQYADKQAHPLQLAQLVRKYPETKFHDRPRHRVSSSRMA